MPGVLTRRTAAYLALAAGLGAGAGLLWEAVVDLPAYLVTADGAPVLSERGLTGVIGGDAWFTLLGGMVGLALGGLAWARLRKLGWPLVVLVVGAAVGAGLLCWLVGQARGLGPVEPRLAVARPGDVVPIELTLRARAALLVWPLAALTPVLLAASLGHDPEEADADRPTAN